jgi:ERCC4-type nuclease
MVKKKKNLSLPTIIIDTREGDPWFLRDTKTICPIVERKLDTGDYSIEGFEGKISIERKSVADAYHTLGRGRERFKQELDRLKDMEFAAIIIEASLEDFASYPKDCSNMVEMKPKTAIQSLIAFSIRYGVHVIWAGSRIYASRYCESLLMKFYKEKLNEI